jgi:hypothetical protein
VSDTSNSAETAQYSVAKRPMQTLPAEQRKAIGDAILSRYIEGEQVANMAQDYGVSDVTLYALLLRERQDEWKDIQTARALARLERAQDDLGTAQDALSLARAREQVRSAQWELERLLRRLYGQEQAQGLGQGTVHINIGINRGTQDVHVIDSIDVTPDAQSGKGEK